MGTMSQLNSLKGNCVELGEYYCEVDPASSTSRISHCFQKGRQKQYRTTSFIAKQWLRQTLIAKLVQLHSSPCKLTIQLMCPASVRSLSSLDNVNEKGNACKRFLGFEDVSAERDAAALTEVVTGTLRKYNPEEKLI